MTVEKVEALATCPFCGGAATMTEMDDRDERRDWFRTITCDDCDATVEGVIGWGTFCKMTREQASQELAKIAAAKWNRREALAALPGRAEAVVDIEGVLFSSMVEAACKSSWLPHGYSMNDWVAVVCSFLRYGPAPQGEPPTEPAPAEGASGRENGPYGYLIIDPALDEEHWQYSDSPETDPELISIALFTHVDPFKLVDEARAAAPAPAEDDETPFPPVDEIVAGAIKAVALLDDWTNVNETEFTGWGDGDVPPGATFMRVKSGQALRAIKEIAILRQKKRPAPTDAATSEGGER